MAYLPNAQQQLKEKLQLFQQQEITNHKKTRHLYSDIFNLLLAPVFEPSLYEEKSQQLAQLKRQKDKLIKNFIKETALSLDQQQRKRFFRALRLAT
ncbi:hypothetical protein [Isorropodon fossajaponicum symbiont]|uniref:hypothetical protein n=1 Tax=Isorropodon fossajaponicum symbiont TaxID=883811 RepID=UPI001914FA52|nr:hypothetical protein [Isorropodon fossajaponicum symbiont]